MRLIDADKLIEVLNKKRVPFNANVNDAILTAPTVDAVKIVRCKDCKHYCPVYADTMGGRDCLLLKTITKADDYCSYGERKNDD